MVLPCHLISDLPLNTQMTQPATPPAPFMKNPHIIVGENRRCLCGLYGITELLGERPTSCADLLAALERLVQTKDGDAILLCEAITPLIVDCGEISIGPLPIL